MNSLISSGVMKAYGSKQVLQEIDLELEPGKIYGMIGRNGAGKTTLLSVLSAQNPASGGKITYGGQPVWENQKVLDHICFSRELNPLNGSGLAPLKIKEYLRIASIYYPFWDAAMADRLVKAFDLDIRQRIGKLSKGMLSMVTIVVAMASKADFTFLDEPVSGLDVVAREHFYQLLLDEFADTGRTFVISTHILEEAADIFEEVIIVDKGRILLKENTQELLERAYHISGHEDEVDTAISSLNIYHEEHLGRSKGVTVLLKPGECLKDGADVNIQKPSLQKLFAALCGEGESHA